MECIFVHGLRLIYHPIGQWSVHVHQQQTRSGMSARTSLNSPEKTSRYSSGGESRFCHSFNACVVLRLTLTMAIADLNS